MASAAVPVRSPTNPDVAVIVVPPIAALVVPPMTAPSIAPPSILTLSLACVAIVPKPRVERAADASALAIKLIPVALISVDQNVFEPVVYRILSAATDVKPVPPFVTAISVPDQVPA